MANKEEAIAQFIVEITKTIQQTKDVSTGQIPPFVQELVSWSLAKDYIGAAIWLLVFLVSTFLVCSWIKAGNNPGSFVYKHDAEGCIVVWVVLMITSFGLLIYCSFPIMQFYIVPNIYALEALKGL